MTPHEQKQVDAAHSDLEQVISQLDRIPSLMHKIKHASSMGAEACPSIADTMDQDKAWRQASVPTAGLKSDKSAPRSPQKRHASNGTAPTRDTAQTERRFRDLQAQAERVKASLQHMHQMMEQRQSSHRAATAAPVQAGATPSAAATCRDAPGPEQTDQAAGSTTSSPSPLSLPTNNATTRRPRTNREITQMIHARLSERLKDRVVEPKARMHDMLKPFDTFKTGAVHYDDFAGVLRNMNVQLSRVEEEKFLRHVDSNGNGVIDVEEVAQVMGGQDTSAAMATERQELLAMEQQKAQARSLRSALTCPQGEAEKRMVERRLDAHSTGRSILELTNGKVVPIRKALTSMDASYSGVVTVPELKAAFAKLGGPLHIHQIAGLAAEYGTPEGYIRYHDLCDGLDDQAEAHATNDTSACSASASTTASRQPTPATSTAAAAAGAGTATTTRTPWTHKRTQRVWKSLSQLGGQNNEDWHRAFTSLDPEHTGVVSIGDFKKGLHSLGARLSNKDMEVCEGIVMKDFTTSGGGDALVDYRALQQAASARTASTEFKELDLLRRSHPRIETLDSLAPEEATAPTSLGDEGVSTPTQRLDKLVTLSTLLNRTLDKKKPLPKGFNVSRSTMAVTLGWTPAAETEQSAEAKRSKLAMRRLRDLIDEKHSSVAEQFAAMDTDRSTTLSASEFKEGLAKAGVQLSNRDAHALVHEMDANRDGQVDLNEFKAALGVDQGTAATANAPGTPSTPAEELRKATAVLSLAGVTTNPHHTENTSMNFRTTTQPLSGSITLRNNRKAPGLCSSAFVSSFSLSTMFEPYEEPVVEGIRPAHRQSLGDAAAAARRRSRSLPARRQHGDAGAAPEERSARHRAAEEPPRGGSLDFMHEAGGDLQRFMNARSRPQPAPVQAANTPPSRAVVLPSPTAATGSAPLSSRSTGKSLRNYSPRTNMTSQDSPFFSSPRQATPPPTTPSVSFSGATPIRRSKSLSSLSHASSVATSNSPGVAPGTSVTTTPSSSSATARRASPLAAHVTVNKPKLPQRVGGSRTPRPAAVVHASSEEP